MRARLLLTAAVAAAAATVVPAAPATAVACYPLPTGHCISPCEVNNSAWDVIERATREAVRGPRCYN